MLAWRRGAASRWAGGSDSGLPAECSATGGSIPEAEKAVPGLCTTAITTGSGCSRSTPSTLPGFPEGGPQHTEYLLQDGFPTALRGNQKGSQALEENCDLP